MNFNQQLSRYERTCENERSRREEEEEDRQEVVSRMFDLCKGPKLTMMDRKERGYGRRKGSRSIE